MFGGGARTMEHRCRFGKPSSRTVYRTLPDGTVQRIARRV